MPAIIVNALSRYGIVPWRVGYVVKGGDLTILGKPTMCGMVIPYLHLLQRTDHATLREVISAKNKLFLLGNAYPPRGISGVG